MFSLELPDNPHDGWPIFECTGNCHFLTCVIRAIPGVVEGFDFASDVLAINRLVKSMLPNFCFHRVPFHSALFRPKQERRIPDQWSAIFFRKHWSDCPAAFFQANGCLR